jgi:hypothetical protein
MRFSPLLAATAILAMASGCATNDAKPETAPAAPASPAVVVPPGATVGTAEGLTATPDLDARIAKLEKPGGDKKKLAAVYAERGFQKMNDAQAAPRVKYRAALKDYRRALALDPKNEKARENKELIEGIYTSMGRPIPGD